MKEYERGALSLARKVVPRFVPNYHYFSSRDYPETHYCSFCGKLMYFYRSIGNVDQYACDGLNCANNPNSYWKSPLNPETIPHIGNNERRIHLPIVRRV